MSTANTSLVAPTALQYAYLDATIGVGQGTDPFNASEDGSGFYFGWESTYRTFQIRYRRRLRVKPTSTKAGGWKGWEAWKGAEYCSKSTSRGTYTRPSDTQDWNTWNMANARPGSSTNLYSANSGVYKHFYKVIPEGFGTYDAEQWQVQVRAYDEGAKKHGNVATATVDVVYDPVVSYTRAVLDDDGGILVYYTTTWNRDGNTVDYGAGRTVQNVKGGINGTRFKLPVSKISNYDVGDTLRGTFAFMTPDAGEPTAKSAVALTIESKYAQHSIQARMSPLDIDHDLHKVTVTLTEPGQTYPWNTVKVWAGWTGLDGVWRTVSPSKVVSEDKAARTGTYEFTNVPSDIPVKFRAQVESVDADSDDPTTLQRTGTLKSKGRAFLTIGDRCAGLVCALNEEGGVSWARNYAPNVEAEVCAGREREVSRHGTGGTATIQVRGDIVYDTDAWDMGAGNRLADWEAMKRKTGADGWVSLPQGVWSKVCVTGIDIDTVQPSHGVSLSLTEVV